MTMMETSCSQTILQKSSIVLSNGPEKIEHNQKYKLVVMKAVHD